MVGFDPNNWQTFIEGGGGGMEVVFADDLSGGINVEG